MACWSTSPCAAVRLNSLTPAEKSHFTSAYAAAVSLPTHLSLKAPPLPSKFLNPPKTLAPKFAAAPIRSLFTGIIEETGTIKHLGYDQNNSFTMKIQATTVLQDLNPGDSISVNGTCLTVTDFTLTEFSVGLAPETLRRTSLSELNPGSAVNLERAVKPSTRMGGHFVQGHVDGTGEIVAMTAEGDSLWVKIKVSSEDLLKYIVPKGYIAVDGTSLTVVHVYDGELSFDLMLVDYTQKKVVIPLLV